MRRPIREMLRPIYERLEDEQSLLRRSGDASMLVQALLDISADLAVEVCPNTRGPGHIPAVCRQLRSADRQVSQTFESEILRLEASVLVDPKVRDTFTH